MGLNVKYRLDNEEWAVIYLFNGIFKLLKEKFNNINFTYIPITKFPHWVGTPRHGSLIIENPINGKTIVLTYDDNPKNILIQTENTGWDVSKIQKMYCVSMIGEIIKDKDFFKEHSKIDVDKVVEPFSYLVFRTEFDKKYSDDFYLKKDPSHLRKEELLFRGLSYGEREFFMKNCTHPQITITNDDYKKLPEYAEELVKYRCGLSFTGAAEICNRDMELMSLGIPILRPQLNLTKFKEPLIPNVHYIPFDGVHLHEKLEGLIKKWEEVKNNYEFLEYIGNNAREWYLKNSKLDNQINLFINSINLNILLNDN
jgi:hypothetical protein